MIQIRLNGETREIDRVSDVSAVLDKFELPAKRIAVELNGEIVARVKWRDTPVNEGDRLEVVHFVGGG